MAMNPSPLGGCTHLATDLDTNKDSLTFGNGGVDNPGPQ